MVPAIFTIGILLAGLITPAYSAVGSNPALEKIPDRFIVVFKDDIKQDEFVNKHGVEKIKQYKHALKGVAIKGPSAKIDKIKDDPDVLFVQQDQRFQILAQSMPTGIDRSDADLNSIANINGVNDLLDVDIAIIDTGIDPSHSDLNVVGGANFVNFAPNGWVDGNGHGTHVAGTVAASDNGIGVVGIAPDARLWGVKVLDDGGSGYLSDIVEGVDWVTANAGIIDVANLSLGGYGIDDGNCGLTNFDALHLAICNSVAQGVVYVAAAGNSAADASTTIPATYDEVITVSALADFDGAPGGLASSTCRYDVDDTLASFSNYGVDVDIAAPGVCIQSTWKGGGYVVASGTSMASPHVAGAAALYILEHGKPTNQAGVEQVKQGLLNSAIPQNSPDGFLDDSYDGYAEPLLNVVSSSSSEPVHDVAVTSLVTPESAVEGDIVTIDVTVSNQGDTTETFDLTVTDDTQAITIGTVNDISLSTGGSSLQSFNWDTVSLSGDHTITAQVSSVSGEDDTSDNSRSNVVNIIEKIHDVAVNDINVLSSVNQGDVVTVDVTVENLGAFDETFDVTLTDTTDSNQIGSQAVSVISGNTETVSFVWNTDGASEGVHNLEAEAQAVSSETNLSNNIQTKDVTVTIPSNEPASVSISNPSDGSAVNGKVTIVANPSGFSSAPVVEFYVDGTLKKIVVSQPYEFGWHTKGQSIGSHSITVDAYDSSSNSASDSISVMIQEKGAGKGKKKTSGLAEDELTMNLPQNKKQSSVVTVSFDSEKTVGQLGFVIEDVGPVANAGDNQLASVSDTVTLDGSGSFDDDGDPLTYSWSFTELPGGSTTTLSDPSIEMPSFDVDVEGKYVIELIVNDGVSDSAPDTVIVKTSNESPVADAGLDQDTAVGQIVQLDGAGSFDPDGDDLTFSWSLSVPEGSAAALSDSSIQNPTFVVDELGSYVAELTVDDEFDGLGAEATSSDSVTITALNSEPVIEFDENVVEGVITTTEGLSLSVEITATDIDGDALMISAEGLPDFATLETNGEESIVSLEASEEQAFLVINPEFEDAGTYGPIIISASDGSEIVATLVSEELTLVVQESTPDSVVEFLENQIPLLGSEDIKNLGEKVSFAANLHKYLVGATKQERADFQEAFHDYKDEAKKILGIGQSMNEKLIINEISKTGLKLDQGFEKLNTQEENEKKIKDAKLLKQKRQELDDTIKQLVAIDYFIKKQSEKEKQIQELTAKKLSLMKEVMIEEARQSNADLTEEEIKKIDKIEKSSHAESSSQNDDGDKSNKDKGNSGSAKSDSTKSDTKSNKGKSDNSNKGGKGKSKK